MKRILIANRGEIAVRIAKAVRAAGLESVAVYSEADAGAMHVAACDFAVHIGPAEVGASYLVIDKLLKAAADSGADAVHPGYGFLSENAGFAAAVVEAGLTWIGPPAVAIESMGDKARAKALMEDAGVPVLPGWRGTQPSAKDAAAVGCPLVIKAVAGGGGRGMRVVRDLAEFDGALESAQREASSAFGSGDVLLERYVEGGRHVEVQVLADGSRALSLGERECSVQRRHQKVIEEAPSVAVDADLRTKMGRAAVQAAEAVAYVGAGTVEFLLEDDGSFWFLEMNTRLQVEHPVTEAVWGVDLVDWQLRIAAGEALPEALGHAEPQGWAIEARLYAEDPAQNYMPQSGRILAWDPPAGLRVDTGVQAGDDVSPYYDPMIAKLIAVGNDRDAARHQLIAALRGAPLLGPTTNSAFLADVLAHEDFATGAVDTLWLERAFSSWAAPEPSEALVAAAALLSSLPDPMVVPFGSRGAVDWPITLDERSLRVVPVSGRRYTVGSVELEVLSPTRLRIDGVARDVTVAREGRTLHLAVVGLGQDVFVEPDPLDRAAAESVGDGTIRAPMAGRVVQVKARPGDVVELGAILLVVEAMKMEHHLLANVAGTVAEVRVGEGDQVARRNVLVVIEPA